MLLIVGANSYLAKKWISQNRSNLPKDSIIYSKSSDSDFCINLRNDINLNDIPENITRAIIFAGISSHEVCKRNYKEAWKINVEGTYKLIKNLNKRNIKCLFLSSNAVFSNQTEFTGETDERIPDSNYGKLKVEAEDLLLKNPINSVLRITKVLDNESKIIMSWHHYLSRSQPIEVFKDFRVSPVRSIHVVNQIDFWIRNNFNGIFHLSSSYDLTYYDFACEFAKRNFYDKNLIIPVKIIDKLKDLEYKPKKANLDCNFEQSSAINNSQFWQT